MTTQKQKKDIAVFLFDVSGKAAAPWLAAGYECWIVDIQHPAAYHNDGITEDFCGSLKKVHADLTIPWIPPFDRNRIAFVAAWPPCDHLAVSGSRWFRGKGLRLLSSSIAMFATAADFCEWSGAPYIIENPVSNISSHWRKSDYRFSPEQYTGFCLDDRYFKKTCLWTGGGLVMPPENIHPDVRNAIELVKRLCGRTVPIKKALEAAESGSQREYIKSYYPDDRIHMAPPGPERHNVRSESPSGFCEALFLANAPARSGLAPKPI